MEGRPEITEGNGFTTEAQRTQREFGSLEVWSLGFGGSKSAVH